MSYDGSFSERVIRLLISFICLIAGRSQIFNNGSQVLRLFQWFPLLNSH